MHMMASPMLYSLLIRVKTIKKKLFENYCIKFKTLFVREINVPGINNKSVGSTFCAS